MPHSRSEKKNINKTKGKKKEKQTLLSRGKRERKKINGPQSHNQQVVTMRTPVRITQNTSPLSKTHTLSPHIPHIFSPTNHIYLSQEWARPDSNYLIKIGLLRLALFNQNSEGLLFDYSNYNLYWGCILE